MTKFIQGKDGKFAGSIGEGKSNPPSPAPLLPPEQNPHPLSPSASPSQWAQTLLSTLLLHKNGHEVKHLVVQHHPSPTVVAAFDVHYQQVWNQSDSPDATGADELASLLSDLSSQEWESLPVVVHYQNFS